MVDHPHPGLLCMRSFLARLLISEQYLETRPFARLYLYPEMLPLVHPHHDLDHAHSGELFRQVDHVDIGPL